MRQSSLRDCYFGLPAVVVFDAPLTDALLVAILKHARRQKAAAGAAFATPKSSGVASRGPSLGRVVAIHDDALVWSNSSFMPERANPRIAKKIRWLFEFADVSGI
jgi:hypothetical protein